MGFDSGQFRIRDIRLRIASLSLYCRRVIPSTFVSRDCFLTTFVPQQMNHSLLFGSDYTRRLFGSRTLPVFEQPADPRPLI